jgi:hypothetical protein
LKILWWTETCNDPIPGYKSVCRIQGRLFTTRL